MGEPSPVVRVDGVESLLREAVRSGAFVDVHFRADPPEQSALLRPDLWREGPAWFECVVVGVAWFEDVGDWEPFCFHVGQIDGARLASLPAEAARKLRPE